MGLEKQIGYVEGLLKGLDFDESKAEFKAIIALSDALKEAYDTIDDLKTRIDTLENSVNANSDAIVNLYDLNEEVLDVVDDLLDEYEPDDYDDDDYYDDFDDYDDDDYFDEIYEVTCGKCGKKINLTEDDILMGDTECPFCGEELEFDFSALEEHECDCEECNHDHKHNDHFDEDLMS